MSPRQQAGGKGRVVEHNPPQPSEGSPRSTAADSDSSRLPAQESQPQGEPRRPKSAAVAAALSFLFPGLGQLYLGRRIAALVFAVPSAAVIVWAALQLSQGVIYFGTSLLDQTYALIVMVVAAGFTAWRAVSISHPFLVVRPRRLGLRATAVLAALLIATVGMGDVVYSNANDFYNLAAPIAANNDELNATDTPSPSLAPTATGSATVAGSPTSGETTGSPTGSPSPSLTSSPSPSPTKSCAPSYSVAYSGGSAAAADAALGQPPAEMAALAADANTDSPSADATDTATAKPTPTPTVEPTPTRTPTPVPTATPTLQPTPTGSPSPSPSPSPNPRRLTILLVGVDFISGRAHALTDTLLLVSINLDTKDVAMVSVPRDTANFPYYWGGTAPVTMKINSLVKNVASGKVKSPDLPMITLANEIGYLVGIPVDYYAAIDMTGFSDLVDTVGGVDIYNPSILNDPSSCTYVPKGNVHLNGSQALHYVRSRESTSDYYRAGRQQRVLVALKSKLATPGIVPRIGKILKVVGKSLATNFPLNTVKNYVKTAEQVKTISRCVLGPPYNYHPDSRTTSGSWTSRLKLDKVANLSVSLFGTDSRYSGQPGVIPTPCQNNY